MSYGNTNNLLSLDQLFLSFILPQGRQMGPLGFSSPLHLTQQDHLACLSSELIESVFPWYTSLNVNMSSVLVKVKVLALHNN